jgi:hypothetical protein
MALLRRRKKLSVDSNEAIFKEMARLKMEIETLTAKYKLLEAKAKNTGVKKLKLPEGNFSLVTKENWTVVDNRELFDFIGEEKYVEYSSISKKGIKDAGGESLVKEVTEKGLIKLKSKTTYFLFKKA